MNHIRIRKLMPLVLATIFVLALFFSIGGNRSNPGSKYALSAPTFVGVAQADTDNAATDLIQNEAGISAYFHSSTPVTISSVRSIFETIELETTDYILGTVALANYPENHAPHVYVHIDGWFLAYYINSDPVAKIIDWNAYTASGDTIISTKLESVLTIMAGAAGVGLGDITHYDFRFPNATTMMLIVERDQGANNNYFTVNIPTSFGVSERSWSYDEGNCVGQIGLNNTTLGGGCDVSGAISAAQMPPATTHTIWLARGGALGGIALVYTE